VTGSLWQRVTTMFVQLYGMVINALSVVFMLALFVAIEYPLRSFFTR